MVSLNNVFNGILPTIQLAIKKTAWCIKSFNMAPRIYKNSFHILQQKTALEMPKS